MQSETQRLRDLCSLIVDCPHSTPVWTESGYIVIRNQNIKGGRLDLSSPSFTDAEHFAHRIRRAKPTAGDIIFTREAPMGEVCMVPPKLECCVGQRQVLLRPNPKVVDGRFLLYALQSPQVQHEISWSEGTGSTVSNVRIPVLEALRIPTPDLTTQQEIGVVLGMLDDRIDLLRQTNATLESIAQALFKSWFIHFDPVRAKAEGREPEGMDAATAALFPTEFEESALGLIPKGWQVCELGQICRLEWGNTTITKKSYVDSGFPAFSAAGQDGYVDIAERQGIGSVISAIGTVGIVHLATKQWTAIKNTLTAQCSTDKESAWLHNLLRTVQFPSRGSTQQFISQADARAVKVVAPPKELRIAFGGISEALISGMVIAQDKSKSLSEIRDSLLSRLISGKLRLPEAQEQVEDALA